MCKNICRFHTWESKNRSQRDGTIFPESRMDARVFSFFFLFAAAQQEAVRVAAEHPKRNQAYNFHLVKHNATLLPCFFFFFQGKHAVIAGGRETHLQ